MEAGAVVEMAVKNKTLSEARVHFEALVCDGDSSVGAALRDASNGQIRRMSDVTHSVKHLGNYLYVRKNNEINVSAIDYLKRMAGCAIKCNKDLPEKVAEALLAVPFHAFGKHEKCLEWCDKINTEMEADQENFSKHLFAPIDIEGSPTFDSNLLIVVEAFQKLVEKAEDLAPNGSTQPNESLNSIVASKAPKRVDYSRSKAVAYRAGAAVLQKNEGVGYTSKLRQLNLMSPGRKTIAYKKRLSAVRRQQQIKKRMPEFKKRRRTLLFKHKGSRRTSESKEGITYQSGMIILINF